MQIDGWYIDASFALDYGAAYQSFRSGGKITGCDRYEMKQVGNGKRGYPVWDETTMFAPSGKETASFSNEVMILIRDGHGRTRR